MAIVTKIEQFDNRDPQIKVVGIVTLEDIIGELIKKDHNEIGDDKLAIGN